MARQVLPADLKEGDVLTPASAPDKGFTIVQKIEDDTSKEAVAVYLGDGTNWSEYWFFRDHPLTVSEAKSA